MIGRLMYYGPLEWGSTSLQILEALQPLVEHVYAVDARILQGEYTTRSPWLRAQIRLGRGPLISRVSSLLLREARRYRPDVLWVDQGLCVTADTLQAIKDCLPTLCVHYTPDILTGKGFDNACFFRALSRYDLCITTKPTDVDRYQRHGARRVFVSQKAVDPSVHRPMVLTDEERKTYGCHVAFAGHRGDNRARSLTHLVANVSCTIHLYGRNWERGPTGRMLGPLAKGWVFGQEYAKALSGAEICLCFLSSEYGDTFTQRSVEIPACRAFMLAERTDAHIAVFEEDKEAAYFDSDAELVDKVRFYLRHDSERSRIAEAGYRKVLKAGFTWTRRMEECVAEIAKIGSHAP